MLKHKHGLYILEEEYNLVGQLQTVKGLLPTRLPRPERPLLLCGCHQDDTRMSPFTCNVLRHETRQNRLVTQMPLSAAICTCLVKQKCSIYIYIYFKEEDYLVINL